MTKKEEVLAAMALFDKNKPEKTFDQISQVKMGMGAVVHCLHKKDQAVTSKEISDALHVSSARMTVLLQKMEGEGLVEKSHSPTDARAILVSLTTKGLQKAEEIERQRYECIAEILEEYTLEDLERLFQQLEKIHQIFYKALKKHQEEESIP